MDDSFESYLLLLLSDGNLPTGSFVASSGLESYVTHGFFGRSATKESSTGSNSRAANTNQATVNFIQDSLGTYARSALPFVSDAHIAITEYCSSLQGRSNHSEEKADVGSESTAFQCIIKLDRLYEAMTLNEVTRRASKAQGVALLTLFSKGFSKPLLPSFVSSKHASDETLPDEIDRRKQHFVDTLKLMVRRGETSGHLPVCWGVLTGALGLSLDRSQHLHLFLQARSLLSASVRLNTLGPYAAQQILLHIVRPLVDKQITMCMNLRINVLEPTISTDVKDGVRDGAINEEVDGPANTWPLGEILAARHDLQHTRVFNS